MIRKQLYIGESHDRALKRRARELGVSEAELVRRLLDGLAVEGGGGALAGSDATAALEGFFAEWHEALGTDPDEALGDMRRRV